MAVMVQDLVRVRGGAIRRPALNITRLQVAVAMSIFFAIVLLDAMVRPLAGFDLPLIKRIQASISRGSSSYLRGDRPADRIGWGDCGLGAGHRGLRHPADLVRRAGDGAHADRRRAQHRHR